MENDGRKNEVREFEEEEFGLEHTPVSSQPKIQNPDSKKLLDSAIQQLRLYPQDPYLQYVVMQLAHSSGRIDEATRIVDRLTRSQGPRQRQNNVNAFGIFSGAFAIHESLQLDRLTADTNLQGANSRESASMPIDQLQGPTIKGHPWKEMLAGKTPAVSSLAKTVPADFYLVESRSVAKLLELKATADLWGQHVATQSTQTARSQYLVDRLLEQLAIDVNDPLPPFYDKAVSRIAIAGSDLFFREGTDVTFLFEMRQPELFRARMQSFLQESARQNSDARKSSGEVGQLKYSQLATPDRRVHVIHAELPENRFVCTNSMAALQRITESINGLDFKGNPVRSLGDSLEFQTIRTLMETDADDEDVFVYLSDPFIRRLVGPQLKLTGLRRMVCYNHLRMIGHASLLYLTRFGKQPDSIDQLVKTGCAPASFSSNDSNCPDGGRYQLSHNGTCSCSHHGNVHSMNRIVIAGNHTVYQRCSGLSLLVVRGVA